MSESPDIPALIAELAGMRAAHADGMTLPDHDFELIIRVEEALTSMISTERDFAELIAEARRWAKPIDGYPVSPHYESLLNRLAAALSVSQPTTASSEEFAWENDCGEMRLTQTRSGALELAEAFHGKAFVSTDGKQSWVQIHADVPATLSSVPLAVTAEQIAEALENAMHQNGTGIWARGERDSLVNAVMALLARSGGALNFNSQPDLKETGTSGGAPTAQQVPSVEEGCPSISPSDQRCIAKATVWHETHFDRFSSSWKDYAAKIRGRDHAAIRALLSAQPADEGGEKA